MDEGDGFGVADGDAVAAGAFGLVHGHIGGIEEFVSALVFFELCDAEAGGDGFVDAGDRDVFDESSDALGKLFAGGAVASGRDDEEFFAAPAADGVWFSEVKGEDGTELCKDFVADVVAVEVVKSLEEVDVGKDNGERLGVSSATFDFGFEEFGDGGAVEHGGEGVFA